MEISSTFPNCSEKLFQKIFWTFITMPKLIPSPPVRRKSLNAVNMALTGQIGSASKNNLPARSGATSPLQDAAPPAAKKTIGPKNANLSRAHLARAFSSSANLPGRLAIEEARLPNVYFPVSEVDHATHVRNQEALEKAFIARMASPEWQTTMDEIRKGPELAEHISILRGGPRGVQLTLTPDAKPILGKEEKAQAEEKWCFFKTLHTHLFSMIKEAQIDTGIYKGKPGDSPFDYSRNAILSHKGRFPFVIQGFGWKPGNATPSHDHLRDKNCTSFVVQGNMKEFVYEPENTAVEVNGEKHVALREKNDRPLGSVAGFDYGRLNVPHILANESDELAVTFHVYEGMDGLSENQQVNARTKLPRDDTPDMQNTIDALRHRKTDPYGKALVRPLGVKTAEGSS